MSTSRKILNGSPEALRYLVVCSGQVLKRDGQNEEVESNETFSEFISIAYQHTFYGTVMQLISNRLVASRYQSRAW